MTVLGCYHFGNNDVLVLSPFTSKQMVHTVLASYDQLSVPYSSECIQVSRNSRLIVEHHFNMLNISSYFAVDRATEIGNGAASRQTIEMWLFCILLHGEHSEGIVEECGSPTFWSGSTD